MKVLVCGGRNYDNREFLDYALNIFDMKHEIELVIEGGAHGADQLAATWADHNDRPRMTFHANWKLHGKKAGPIRNKRMLDFGKPDAVIAFEGGKGTESMCKLAEAAGVKVWKTWK